MKATTCRLEGVAALPEQLRVEAFLPKVVEVVEVQLEHALVPAQLAPEGGEVVEAAGERCREPTSRLVLRLIELDRQIDVTDLDCPTSVRAEDPDLAHPRHVPTVAARDKLEQALEDGNATSPSVAIYEQGVDAAIASETERKDYERAMRDSETPRERVNAAADLITRLIRDCESAAALHPNAAPAIRRRYLERLGEAFNAGEAVWTSFGELLSPATAGWLIDNGFAASVEGDTAVDRLREAADRRE